MSHSVPLRGWTQCFVLRALQRAWDQDRAIALLGAQSSRRRRAGIVRRRLFRAARDPEADRDAVRDCVGAARGLVVWRDVFGAEGEARLYPAWMLLFGFGSMTPAQLARALPCTKAGVAKLLRQLKEGQFAVHHGAHEPLVCSAHIPNSFSFEPGLSA